MVQTPRALAITALRGLLVSANWFIFIWAVNVGHIVETSLVYFITPLLNLVFRVSARQAWAITSGWLTNNKIHRHSPAEVFIESHRIAFQGNGIRISPASGVVSVLINVEPR